MTGRGAGSSSWRVEGRAESRTTVASALSRGEVTTPGSLWRLPLGGWSMAPHHKPVSAAWLEQRGDNRGDKFALLWGEAHLRLPYVCLKKK